MDLREHFKQHVGTTTPRKNNKSRLKLPKKEFALKSNYVARRILPGDDSSDETNNNFDADLSHNYDVDNTCDELEFENVDDFEESEDLDEKSLQHFTQQFTQEEVEPESSFDHGIDLSQQSCDSVVDISASDSFDNNVDHSTDQVVTLDFAQDYSQYGDKSPSRFFKRRKGNNVKTTSKAPMNDSEDMVYLIVGNVRRVFKTHEVYEPKSRAKKENYLYQIKSLIYKQRMTKMAVCEVFRKLSDTYVESRQMQKQALGQLMEDYEWIKTDREKMMQKYKWVKLMHPYKIPLSELGEKVNKPPPKTNLFYFENPKGTRHGFTFVYKLMSTGQENQVFRGKVLELFAGVGGMSRGFVNAGFDVQWAVENDKRTAATFQINHPTVQLFDEDVALFLKKVKNGDLPYKQIKPDHIHASPPCQGFSKANRNGGKCDEKNRRATLTFLEVVRHFQPKTVSMENVTGMVDSNKEHYLKIVVSSLIAMEYNVRMQILDSSRYGDPQQRSRIFVTASKASCRVVRFPPETHGSDKGQLPLKTVLNAIGSLSKIEPAGGSGAVCTTDGDSSTIFNHNIEGTALKADPDKLEGHKPARTIRRTKPVQHYSLPRSLTVREYARLQSFDDSFRFYGSISEQRNQIGNAVPSGLATAVALAIREYAYCLQCLSPSLEESKSSGNRKSQDFEPLVTVRGV